MADICALSTVDFAHWIGLPIDADRPHLTAWHERMKARPSADGLTDQVRLRTNFSAVRLAEKAQTLVSTRPQALAAAITSTSFTRAALPFSETIQSAPRCGQARDEAADRGKLGRAVGAVEQQVERYAISVQRRGASRAPRRSPDRRGSRCRSAGRLFTPSFARRPLGLRIASTQLCGRRGQPEALAASQHQFAAVRPHAGQRVAREAPRRSAPRKISFGGSYCRRPAATVPSGQRASTSASLPIARLPTFDPARPES